MNTGNALSDPRLVRILPGLLQSLAGQQAGGNNLPRGLFGPVPVAESMPNDQPPQADDTRPKALSPADIVRRATTPMGGNLQLPSSVIPFDPSDSMQAPGGLPTLPQASAPNVRPQGGLTGMAGPAASATAAAMPGPRAPAPGFDYDAAMAAMLPQKPKGKGIFGTGIKWYDALGVLGDALAAAGGGNGHGYADQMTARRMEQDKRRFETLRALTEWRHQDYGRERNADLQASQPFTLGRSRYQFDPTTGQTTALQTEPMDFETYAASQGYQPGTPEYNQAAQDYILRGNGPTAVGLDASLDDHRTGNRVRLEGVRAGNRSALENQRQAGRTTLRGMPTYRDLHPSAGGGRGGNIPTVKTPQEAMALPPGTKFRTPDGRVKVRP